MYILLGKGGKVTKTVCPLPIDTRAAIFYTPLECRAMAGKLSFYV
ncbi:hypothetical protein HMPREF3033_01839 [Veillonellaceae bacterium DNF00751]|nr:hypothetical protein HMPREF3033_01839 [Veillonellaceae bacterium DNF00751]